MCSKYRFWWFNTCWGCFYISHAIVTSKDSCSIYDERLRMIFKDNDNCWPCVECHHVEDIMSPHILWVPEQMVVHEPESQSQCFMCLFHSTCGHRLDNTWFTDLKTWFLWSNTWYYSVSDDIIWENIPFLCEIFILFKATINSSIKLA